MAKLENHWCKHCKKETEHSWTFDPDSDPEEPKYILICNICLEEEK